MAAILAKIQTQSLNFKTDRNVKDLPQQKLAELKMLDSLATIAVMDRDVIAVVTSKYDDIINISNTNWKPRPKVLAACSPHTFGVGQAVSLHSSMKRPLIKQMPGFWNTGCKDKDIRKPIPQQDSSMMKRPLKWLMFSMNTCPDDKNVGRPIPQGGIPIILDTQPPAHFDLKDKFEDALTTYVKACW